MDFPKSIPAWLIGIGLISCAALVGMLAAFDRAVDTPWGTFRVEKAADVTRWHTIIDTKPFDLACDYKIRIADFFNRGSTLVVDANMVSRPQISGFFFGGGGADNFGLFVKSDSKTTAWQGREGTAPRPVSVMERCMSPAR
jgi:hypothetical protein